MRFRFDLGVSIIQLRSVLRVQNLAKTIEMSSPVLRYRNIGLWRLFFRTS
jgi:hypothetical protein